jgi:hypothetical protein
MNCTYGSLHPLALDDGHRLADAQHLTAQVLENATQALAPVPDEVGLNVILQSLALDRVEVFLL